MGPSDPLVHVFADALKKRPVRLRPLTEWELLCRRVARQKQAAQRAGTGKKRKKGPKQLPLDFTAPEQIGAPLDADSVTAVAAPAPAADPVAFEASDADLPF